MEEVALGSQEEARGNSLAHGSRGTQPLSPFGFQTCMTKC